LNYARSFVSLDYTQPSTRPDTLAVHSFAGSSFRPRIH